jgi:hypothetical protein
MEAAAMKAAAMKAATSAAALAVAEIGRGSKDRQNNSKDYREFVCHRASPIRARLAPDSDYRLRSGHQVFLCFLNASLNPADTQWGWYQTRERSGIKVAERALTTSELRILRSLIMRLSLFTVLLDIYGRVPICVACSPIPTHLRRERQLKGISVAKAATSTRVAGRQKLLKPVVDILFREPARR